VNGHDETNLNVKPGRLTVVVLMGIGRAAAIARRFMECGWSADTPSAIVFDASTPRQQAWRGSLEQLAADARAVASDGPGTIVIGEVAAMNVFEHAQVTREERVHVGRR
jgi:siroheme synthase